MRSNSTTKDLLSSLSENEKQLLMLIMQNGDRNDLKNLIGNAVSVLYNEYPVSMEEFLLGKKYLNLENYLYPRVKDLLLEIDKPHIREVDLLLGKGSGKSTLSSITLVRSVYKLLCFNDPQLAFGLFPNQKIATLNLSVRKEQAKDVVFHNMLQLLERSIWFSGKYVDKSNSIEFPREVTALSGHSGATAWLGYNVYTGVMDEVEFMVDNEKRSIAQELYEALKGACSTRFPDHYKIVSISSVRSARGFLMKRFEQVKKTGQKIEYLSKL